MIAIGRHMAYFRGSVALLLFLSSSGFTTILHNCVMEASECCDISAGSDQKGCETPLTAVAGESVQGLFDCHTNTVVGGPADIQAVAEKDGKHLNQKLELLSLLSSHHASLSPLSINANRSNLISSGNVSPPSVEKYILTAALLI